MTEKKLYTCDICGTDYANKEEAEKCEKKHTVSTVIKDLRYNAHEKYPYKIAVKFTDGKTIWYRT